MVEHLRRVQDVIEVDYIENTAEAFALVRLPAGRKPVAGKAGEVEEAIAQTDCAAYVMTYGAL